MPAIADLKLDQKDEKSPSPSPSLFNQIYEIAKGAENNEDTIQKLSQILTPDTCIDVRDGTGMQTPAGKLAKEGNKKAVDLLMKLGANVDDIASGAAFGGHRDYAEHLRVNHSARVNYIARGAAQGGHRKYAEYLRIHHGAGVDDIASGAAQGGHRKYAEYLRIHHGADVDGIAKGAAQGGHRDYAEYLRINHDAYVNYIARGAAQGGHRKYAEYLRIHHGAGVDDIASGAAQGGHRDYAEYLYINHGANVNDIARGMADSGDFAHRAGALHSLSFMENDEYRILIAKELKKLMPYDVTKLIPKAQKIAELRPRYNYSQCIALGNRQIQTWYLQCAVLIKQRKLAPELFLSIATYLSPLTLNEASDLYEKSRFDMFQKLLVKGIDRHCVQTRTLYFFNRDEKAEEFSVACTRTKGSDQLIQLLNCEKKKISGDEKSQQPYNNLISKHL